MSATAIHYQVLGEGEPLVLLHGLLGSLENLGGISRLLADDYRIHSLDLPGHGRSANSPERSYEDSPERSSQLTLASMADNVVAWMDSVGLSQVYLLGHSLGGKVAMEIALKYPEKVQKLVVVDIAPVRYPRRHDTVFAALKAVDLSNISSRAEAENMMATHLDEPFIRSFLLKNLEKVESGWQWRCDLDGLISSYDQLLSANTSTCPVFDKPVLFIKGQLSNYILPEYQAAVLSLFSNPSIKSIDGTGHWLHAEKPDILAGIVKRFLLSRD